MNQFNLSHPQYISAKAYAVHFIMWSDLPKEQMFHLWATQYKRQFKQSPIHDMKFRNTKNTKTCHKSRTCRTIYRYIYYSVYIFEVMSIMWCLNCLILLSDCIVARIELHTFGPSYLILYSGADPRILERGGGKGAKTRTKRQKHERRLGASRKKIEKLDAIFCNLAYIFGIRMALDIIQNGACAEQKNSSGHDFDSHTHAHTPPTLPKTPRISATIKSRFNFQKKFSDIVYNV